MGGLGETISTKMVDAGYKVAVTYSPGNNRHGEWVAQMKANGYDILAVPCDVTDINSCASAVARAQWRARRMSLGPSTYSSTTPASRAT
jgi:acetoacetyl-CoA reductase